MGIKQAITVIRKDMEFLGFNRNRCGRVLDYAVYCEEHKGAVPYHVRKAIEVYVAHYGKDWSEI